MNPLLKNPSGNSFSRLPVSPGRLRDFFFLIALFSMATSLMADPIRGEFWVRDDLMEIVSPGDNIRETGDFSERQKNALDSLLEDARWAFSGMIYGFSVSWTPPSRAREVEEDLQIEPLALIPRGDPRMRTVSVSRENGFVYILLEYSPDSSQERRLEGWSSEAFPAAAGAGSAPVNFGSRRDAMKAAIREVLKAYLRVRDFNRPREIKGKVAFTKFPFTSLMSGSVRAAVQLRLDLEPLRPYTVD